MNKGTIRYRIERLLALCAVLPLLLASCTKEEFGAPSRPGGGFRLCAEAEELSPQIVTTRAADPKEEAEREIKTLHIFLFGPDGNYLQAATDFPFQGYKALASGNTSLMIDWAGFADRAAAANATVYAVANVEPGTFDVLTPEGFPANIPDRAALERFDYRPADYESLMDVPPTGMPMVGRTDAIDLTRQDGNVTVYMKALMTRIDVTIRLNSPETDETGLLPAFSLTGYRMDNMPTAVPFTAPASGEETNLDPDGDGQPEAKKNIVRTVAVPRIIYNKQQGTEGCYDFSFYVFENLRKPAVPDYAYPGGITEDEKQRYKPVIADTTRATRFNFSGIYTVYTGKTFRVSYTLYLGADHTDDFNLGRNRQYKNNITIIGLDHHAGLPGEAMLDARVEVHESEPYYLSLLRERNFDAHFSVVPLDIYLGKQGSPSMDIIVDSPETNDWLRLERVSAAEMEAAGWKAETGKRPYFTTDLVSNTLAGNTEYTGLGSRDRIYLYVDENISTKSRKADLIVVYRDGGVERERTTISIEQHGLLKVTVAGDADNPDQVIYAEAYEEYLNHYDPLADFDTEHIYSGLPWGANNVMIGNYGYPPLLGVYAYENYYQGQEFTENILTASGRRDYAMKLNEVPLTAAEYCANKNKRNASGVIEEVKWCLPGIRQLEWVLKTYYSQYPEFQNFYYWSSSAARRTRFGGQSSTYARATKAYLLSDGTIAHRESGIEQDYSASLGHNSLGGRAPRTTVLRIRSIYIPDEGEIVE